MRSRRDSQRHRHDAVVEEYSRLAEHYHARCSFYVGATTRETIACMSVGAEGRVAGECAIAAEHCGIGQNGGKAA